jgi:hypothetical protein
MSPERGIFSVFSCMTSWFSDTVRAGWSGVQILAGVIDFFSLWADVRFLIVKPSGTSSNQ